MKPGTELPWYGTRAGGSHQGLVISEVTGANVAVTYGGDEDADYIIHACNALPEIDKLLTEIEQRLTECPMHVQSRIRGIIDLVRED